MHSYFKNFNYPSKAMFGINLALLGFIPTIAVSGDALVSYCSDVYLRVFLDSAVHFLIALFSWAFIEWNKANIGRCSMLTRGSIMKCTLCGTLASAMDMDHFIEAGSLQLQNALRISRRPFLHCTTTPIVILAGSILLSRMNILRNRHRDFVKECGWMQFISLVSHHIRDGHRRGIWLCPVTTFTYRYEWYPILLVLLLVLTTVLTKSKKSESQRLNDFSSDNHLTV